MSIGVLRLMAALVLVVLHAILGSTAARAAPCGGEVLTPGSSCGDQTKIGPAACPDPPPSGCGAFFSKGGGGFLDLLTCGFGGLGAPLSACQCDSLPGMRVTSDGKACIPDKPDCEGNATVKALSGVDPHCRTWPIKPKNAVDPNDKVGTLGVGIPGFLAKAGALNYAIHFENLAAATGAAQVVVVTDQLDKSAMDLATFQLGPITFGHVTLIPERGLQAFTGGVDLRPDLDLLVTVTAGLDISTGVVTWRFTSIDPGTGQFTQTDSGFLPPNTAPPAGEGSVMFQVTSKSALATGTTIQNQGSVVFDTNAAIVTPTWLNTIDQDAPVTHVLALPATQSSPTFTVQWTGSDLGSGIATYAVYVSDNGGAFTVWLPQTTDTQATYVGQAGHSYAFYSIASDQAGNVEAAKTIAEATTLVTQGATFTLAVSAIHGSITASPTAASYTSGAQVQLAAAPEPGYTFAGWTGDAASGGLVNPLTITMDGNKTVGASFVATSPCNFVLTPTDLHDLSAAGATPTISIVTPAGCTVVAMSFQPWVSVTAITPGAGTTTVQLQIAPNAGPPRATSVLLAERLFLITQSGQ